MFLFHELIMYNELERLSIRGGSDTDRIWHLSYPYPFSHHVYGYRNRFGWVNSSVSATDMNKYQIGYIRICLQFTPLPVSGLNVWIWTDPSLTSNRGIYFLSN